MAYWLCAQRNGQETDHIQRFDPRFWTVNFPRPMMTSVVTTAPDALRVTCEFHHEGELAGLIWESEDTLDHPLHAYATHRDYAHTVLSFRWRSGGVIALDAVHGPTLTIEGRDASGNPRAWYVRLWNYAEGSPEDARITLAFSALESGFTLPGEAVHPGAIDRMFVSIAPPGYAPGSTAQLAARADGWVELSEIACDGRHAMLEIGDCMLPEHGEQIATAYDDSFNQTPARLVRQIRHLGYRGRVVHYVGMSHYFRLERLGNAHYVSLAGGALNDACAAWHRAYAAEAKAGGLAIIWSLSYELFDAHCWNDWKQRSHDGSPAQTGWVPPSALLSPAHEGAMGYLRQVAAAFVAIAEDAGLPVLFQIGEPWWWVTPGSFAPCLYDDAARTAFGGSPPVISDMREPLDAGQIALLDHAGALLAASTAALAQAVRDAASGPTEILLLAFTPTILDGKMPEIERANLPLGWAWPAFDRLQLEDYDWLTAGADARRRAAYDHVDARLGYPIDRQDYFAGFVLLAEDAQAYWARIDAALNEAQARGVEQRFVWALPQIARDGYTRLRPPEEDDMRNFDDVSYPLALGTDTGVSPEFSTSVLVTASGHERRTAQWADARLRFDVGPGIRSDAELATLLAFFRARHGPARGFRLADPFDHSSGAAVPEPGDQLLGTGDGERTRFALGKAYGEAPELQMRRITRPRAGTVRVAVDGTETSAFTLDPLGEIVLDAPPGEGAEVRAGFLFDVPVRFAEDRLAISAAGFAAGQAPSVPLVEIREAT
ncbi:DUF2460 domain-containing protein [Alteriqipengyuania lutimaris]|uniref:TIGR02217 family protein n=1 Tax=Alteriqipengyuania lutimaris TaxID=1538146 RepID=A0A395LI02_9SPHN|nr:DUF2460 domain-containing protein [Alteriqipengyuania lutimaris]MBB3034536.1 uncharacterized protein (TIGR02217 family) [Alteriqipengyuania lutimaris]RDS76578.1 TIGR02217 family protein [Alteriqipengyuania lutimaris]